MLRSSTNKEKENLFLNMYNFTGSDNSLFTHPDSNPVIRI